MLKARENSKEVLDTVNNVQYVMLMIEILNKNWKQSEKGIKQYIKDKIEELENI